MKENKIVLGLGSNIGDKKGNLQNAIKKLQNIVSIQKLSSLYLNPPFGYLDQEDFLNMVIQVSTSLKPPELLQNCLKIENEMGRKRKIKNGPRVIDIDIIFFNDESIQTTELTIPHPEAHKRASVLTPLAEICPDLIHPQFNVDIKTLLSKLKPPPNITKYGSIQD